MKKIIAIVAATVIAAGSVYAGCGKKVTDAGTLKSIDAEAKSIVVAKKGGKEAKLTLTPKTEYKNAEGKKVEAKDLEGKKVTVVSEHKKVDSITEAKAKS